MIGRIYFVLFFFSFCFFAIVVRLFYWQVVKADEIASLGKSQYGRYIPLPSERGEIKTADGFPIATNTLSYLVFANPKEVKEKEKTTTLLASLLEADSATIAAVLALDKLWVPLKTNVPITGKEAVEKMNLQGIGFEQQSTRFYPEASLAAQLIGFVGKDELGDQKGYFGLEGYYDRQLRGKPGLAVQVHDALGRPILSRMNDAAGAINGRNLKLSIDRSIQYIVEKKLKEGIERYQAEGGMVGIIDPKTGSVLAIASYPSFDQRTYAQYSDTLYRNPFISNLYEPGSTFKALVMAAAIDSGKVKPETTCPICAQSITMDGYEIKTWNNTYYKDTTMVEVIQHSDNTGMVYAMQQLGFDTFLHYLKKYGIGELTGIDLQGEVAPSIKPKNNWYQLDIATASFGQGITVTPIELLTAFSSIANEGKRMEPHVVASIETPEGKIIPIQPKVVDTPIKPKTAKVMTEILVNAVEKGEAKWAKPKGYRIAGKTGTAQIPIAGHYDPNKTIASFLGFAPADDPKFAMVVIIDRPTTAIYGSETAAPIFFSIAREIFNYYGILPSE